MPDNLAGRRVRSSAANKRRQELAARGKALEGSGDKAAKAAFIKDVQDAGQARIITMDQFDAIMARVGGPKAAGSMFHMETARQKRKNARRKRGTQ